VLVLDNLRFGRAAVLCLSSGSCQCRVTIQSIFLESGFGSVVGKAIAVDAIDLTSGAASLVYETSSLSAFDKASLRSSVPALRFSDDSASSAGVARRTTSAFVTGTLPDASARASGAMPILTATIVVRPIRHKRASQTVLIDYAAHARSCLLALPCEGTFRRDKSFSALKLVSASPTSGFMKHLISVSIKPAAAQIALPQIRAVPAQE
jgi:hypothetical protein